MKEAVLVMVSVYGGGRTKDVSLNVSYDSPTRARRLRNSILETTGHAEASCGATLTWHQGGCPTLKTCLFSWDS